ncbi:hypothetical protein LINGRAHAP2_LOCUS22827, partial [Linum grandiflorum]
MRFQHHFQQMRLQRSKKIDISRSSFHLIFSKKYPSLVSFQQLNRTKLQLQ